MNVKTKTLFTTLITLFVVVLVTAQKKTKLNIQPNLVLTYSASDPKGNEVLFPVEIKEMNDKNVILKYEMAKGGRVIKGQWVISGKGLESGEYFNWQPLNPSEVRKLPDNQTIFSVSRKFFDEIKRNKTGEYDNKTFELKEIPNGKEIIIDNKVVDALYIVEKGGELKYWILNNRKLPFVINSSGGQGPSFTLSKVEMSK